jgi:hypothetical protein
LRVLPDGGCELVVARLGAGGGEQLAERLCEAAIVHGSGHTPLDRRLRTALGGVEMGVLLVDPERFHRQQFKSSRSRQTPFLKSLCDSECPILIRRAMKADA